MSERIKEGWQRFLVLCQNADSLQNLGELFDLIFTAEEKDALANRVLLVLALLQGDLTQREIAHKLNISIAKITRGSNALKAVSQSLKDYLLSAS